jgi:hypothetical protein
MGLTEGQVRSRFNTLGIALKITPWSKEELCILKDAYNNATINKDIKLDGLAKCLGRHKTNISRKARALGLTNIARKRVHVLKPQNKYSSKEELKKAMSEKQKKWIKENGHPRGALGLKHTEESKKKMVDAIKRAWANPNSKLNSEENKQRRSDLMLRRIISGQTRVGYTRCKGGRRKDLGDTYFRSAWEANYARYLNFLKKNKDIVDWEYEPKTFIFEQIKRGTRAYTPDFRVVYRGGRYEWHEVKGWMDGPSKTRLKRMEKYYPTEKIILIDETWFKSANRQGLSSLLPGWESR